MRSRANSAHCSKCSVLALHEHVKSRACAGTMRGKPADASIQNDSGLPQGPAGASGALNPARCHRTTVSGLTTASADRTSGNSRESPTSVNRSSALKLSRFGAVRRRTRICWRRTRFSASSVALDRNSPISSDQITLQPAHIGREHRPIRPHSPTDEIYDKHRRPYSFQRASRSASLNPKKARPPATTEADPARPHRYRPVPDHDWQQHPSSL